MSTVDKCKYRNGNFELEPYEEYQPVFVPSPKSGQLSVALIILDSNGSNTCVYHQIGLMNCQVEALFKLNGKNMDSIIDLDDNLKVKAQTFCKWIIKPLFDIQSHETQQAMQDSQLGQYMNLFCLFGTGVKYHEWISKSADYVFVFSNQNY